MKKTLVGLLAAATAVIGLSTAPAKADVVFIDSDGTMHNISSDVMLPSSTMYSTRTLVQPISTQVITQPAVIDTTPVFTTPVVQSNPVVIQDRYRRNSLFHLGVWPLLDFSLF